MTDTPIAVLTALDLEYQAVRDRLTDVRVHWHQAGTRFETGRLPGGGPRIALGLAGTGNQPTAVLAERAIAEFRPAALMFVGVAGALWPDIALGDVVVATQVYAYHGGTSEADGLKARPRVWEIQHEMAQIARHLARTGKWRPDPGHTPRVRFGPIATGEIVQDAGDSDNARWIRAHYNDALAIEMEAAGAAQAAHLNRSLPVVVVRGISDRADGTKTVTDGENWQQRAVAGAAAFAVALAGEIVREQGSRNPGSSRQDDRRQKGTTMTGTTRNIASGNAHVGVQAGQVYGDITIGAEPAARPGLEAQLAELRSLLKQARADGQLDEPTYAAAEDELTVVTGALPVTAGPGRDRALLALKRLRGLIIEIADLAARVTAVIAAVRGL